MLKQRIEDIELKDIELLVENRVPEGRTIEYKAELKVDKDGDKKEFLYDVSSFANSLGGDLIYGVGEGSEKGLPGEVGGIEGNMDELKRKIESMVRDIVEPRITDIKIKDIPIARNRSVLIIHIPNSLNKPHQVTFQKTDKFYSRSNSGKYIMDINELRSAFLLSDTIIQKVKAFVKGRIEMIAVKETPALLENVPPIILHLIPIGAIEGQIQVPLQVLESATLLPLGMKGCNKRFNIDGVVNFSSDRGGYIQLYQNGIIETVNTDLLKPFNEKKFSSGRA